MPLHSRALLLLLLPGLPLCRGTVLYKDGRHGAGFNCPYGRVGLHQALPTVFTKPRHDTARVSHPTVDHVLTMRTLARAQGFPDWYMLVSCPARQLENNPNARARSARSARGARGQLVLESQYRMVGNSVAPPLAKALGRCLLAALDPEPPPRGQAVVWLPDPELQQVGCSEPGPEPCPEPGLAWC